MLLPLTTVPVPGPGAEDVLVAPDGRVWTGTAEGAIHVHDPRDGSTTTVTATGGRPLGLENLPDGRILVCDAHRGLLALDPASGDLETLLTEVDGDRLLFTNNAAVAPDGTIWFSDSSRIWPIEEWKNDLIEHTCTGRLLRRSPDGEVTTVLDRLCFANGVALTAEMDAVLVAETGTRTIRRVALGADGSPRATTTWVDDLPGHPDNISLGSDGLVWVTIGVADRPGPAHPATQPCAGARPGAPRAGTAQAHPETHRPGAGPGQRRAHGARPGLRRHALAPGDRGARARRSGLARQPRRTGDRVVRRARGPLVTSRRAPRG